MSEVPVEEGEWDSPEQIERLKEEVKPTLDEWVEKNKISIDNGFYRRWLRARKGDIDAAAKMLLSHIRWRETECPWFPNAPPWQPVEISIRSRKCFIQGRTPEGHPIIYLRAGLHDTYKVDVEETKRFVIFVLEHALHLTGHTNKSKFVVIADFADFGYAGFDREAVNFILKMLSLNYPERLRQLYIVNEGWLFWCLWKLVGPFLDERTSRKIHMLSEDFTMMHEDLGKDNLLEDYGGNLECNYDPDAWCDGERAEDRDAPHATTAGESAAAAGGGKDGVPSQEVEGEGAVVERDNSG